MTYTTLTITEPDDMHLHVRDGDMLRAVLPETTRYFRRAIIMPNLVPGVKTVADAHAYRDRIIQASQKDDPFEPLMTLYLTEETPVEEVVAAYESPYIHAFKYYPRGATTNSSEGVRSFDNVIPQLEMMERLRVPLLIHGEVNVYDDGTPVDPFDKESVFIRDVLPKIRQRHPGLRIVLEHITTADAARYVATHGGFLLGATITPHHLVCDRRALFDGGLNPHYFCLPVLKRSEDTLALRKLATAGKSFVFAGTDSAPHPTMAKERACGCAGGCFVAPIALPMYAQVFEEEEALPHLESFLSHNGADWYGLPRNTGYVKLEKRAPAAVEPYILQKEIPADAALAIRNAVRIFGTHDDPEKSLRWAWNATRV